MLQGVLISFLLEKQEYTQMIFLSGCGETWETRSLLTKSTDPRTTTDSMSLSQQDDACNYLRWKLICLKTKTETRSKPYLSCLACLLYRQHFNKLKKSP